jgi:NAD-dependent deacetylase
VDWQPFVDLGGLWNGYRVEKVATLEAWALIPNWSGTFIQCADETPWQLSRTPPISLSPRLNKSLAIDSICVLRISMTFMSVPARSEFTTCTEHSSSPRCVRCNQTFPDKALYETSASLPKCSECGAAVRPHIVWFGEVPLDMESIFAELDRASILLVVGTSGSVYPAADLVNVANQRGSRSIYVGPQEPLNAAAFDEVVLGTATEILPTLLQT